MLNKMLAAAGAASLLIASAAGMARAADLPMKVPPVPMYSWTGFYGGINGGYGLADDPFNQTLASAGVAETSSINSRVDPNGAIFGGQVGYNYQSGHAVYGVEGDFQWSGQRDTAGCGIECLAAPGVTFIAGSAGQDIKWFGTARARLGWADNGWLLYVTGGGAWAGIDATTAFSETGFGINLAQSNTTGFTRGGWVVGGGAEVRIFGPWSAKFEYLYMDFGKISDTLTISALPFGTTATITSNSKIQDSIIRIGLNYRFN